MSIQHVFRKGKKTITLTWSWLDSNADHFPIVYNNGAPLISGTAKDSLGIEYDTEGGEEGSSVVTSCDIWEVSQGRVMIDTIEKEQGYPSAHQMSHMKR